MAVASKKFTYLKGLQGLKQASLTLFTSKLLPCILFLFLDPQPVALSAYPRGKIPSPPA
jgi:hypothetical protein